MHCPRCGQQQVSDQTKFCSRCGFQLGLVAELLENGGFLPQLAQLSRGKDSFFSRKNGLIFTTLWFIFWVMMMPAFLGMAGEGEAAGVSAIFGTFSSIMFLILTLTVLKRPTRSYELPPHHAPPPATLYGNATVGALPPLQSQPVSTYTPPEGSWRAPDTGDLVRPGSVTEATTRLLKKNE